MLSMLLEIEAALFSISAPFEVHEGYVLCSRKGEWGFYPIVIRPMDKESIHLSLMFPPGDLSKIKDLEGFCREVEENFESMLRVRRFENGVLGLAATTTLVELGDDLEKFVASCDRLHPYLCQVLATGTWASSHLRFHLKTPFPTRPLRN